MSPANGQEGGDVQTHRLSPGAPAARRAPPCLRPAPFPRGCVSLAQQEAARATPGRYSTPACQPISALQQDARSCALPCPPPPPPLANTAGSLRLPGAASARAAPAVEAAAPCVKAAPRSTARQHGRAGVGAGEQPRGSETAAPLGATLQASGRQAVASLPRSPTPYHAISGPAGSNSGPAHLTRAGLGAHGPARRLEAVAACGTADGPCTGPG